MPDTIMGKISITPKDEFSELIPYKRLDLVHYNNKAYLCKVDTEVGILPTNEDYWMVLVEGVEGVDATIEVGTVISGEEGTQPQVINVGTDTNAKFNFVIPVGKKGDTGKNFTIKAHFNTMEDLESGVDSPEIGDIYSVGLDIPYDIYIYDGVLSDWMLYGTIQGAKGEDGKTAYQIAVEQGFTGTVQEWLNSLIGADGAKGDDGDSAYQIAVANGFEGTVSEWLESLQGKDGSDGKDGEDGISEITTSTDTNISGLLKGGNGKVSAAVKTDITALGIPEQDTTYLNATTSVAGLMSAEDKVKLNGIETAADVSVNADWNATEGKAQILNKPTIPDSYTKSESDLKYIQEETDPTVSAWAKQANKPSYTATEVGAVPTTRTVNSKALSANVTLTASDVSAVPTTRTVNNKALSSNITLKTGDVGVSSTTVSLTTSGWSSNSRTVTVSGVTASNNVIVTPASGTHYDNYVAAGIQCTGQGTNLLTFTRKVENTSTITVNVLILS